MRKRTRTVALAGNVSFGFLVFVLPGGSLRCNPPTSNGSASERLPQSSTEHLITPVGTVRRIGEVPVDNCNVTVQFDTARNGWVANKTKLWQTTDAGATWNLLYSGESSVGVGASIEGLQFMGSNKGWMLVSPGVLYTTKDGGMSWIQMPDPNPNGAVHSIVFLRGGKEGWAGGTVDKRPSNRQESENPWGLYTVIAHTTDGGITWSNQFISDTRGISNFSFAGPRQGWALGWPGLYHLDTASNRWIETVLEKGNCARTGLKRTLRGEGYMNEPSAIFLLNQHDGWLAFKNGYIARTKDGGGTWCDLFDPRTLWPNPNWDTFFSAMKFVDPMRGWALGNHSLFSTKDGGSTWLKVDIVDDLCGMYFLEKDGWAVGKGGIYQVKSIE